MVRLNVRTDKWQIITTQQQKELLKNTVSEFRRLVRCLVGVVNTHWTTIGLLDAKAQIPAVEKLIHATSLNPNVVGRTINIVEHDTQFSLPSRAERLHDKSMNKSMKARRFCSMKYKSNIAYI